MIQGPVGIPTGVHIVVRIPSNDRQRKAVPRSHRVWVIRIYRDVDDRASGYDDRRAPPDMGTRGSTNDNRLLGVRVALIRDVDLSSVCDRHEYRGVSERGVG